MKRESSILEKIQYYFDSTVARGTTSMIAWLSILSFVILFLFSICLVILNPADQFPFTNFSEIFWKILNIAMDPGSIVDESIWTARILLLIVTFFGLFIVSTLIGVIGSGVQDKIMDLRRGRSKVLENSHTVILGWSDKIDVVINELMLANEEHKNFSIAILSPRDKLDMEDYLMPRIGKVILKKIHCRSGNPSVVEDLSIVAPQKAKSILILCYDRANGDSVILKRSLALQKFFRSQKESVPIVTEVIEKNNSLAIESTGNIHVICSREFITRVLVQVAREPGLSIVYDELFSFHGCEIYSYKSKGIVGYTISELALGMPNAAVIGFIDSNGLVHINSKLDHSIQENEEILLIAEDDSLILPFKQADQKDWPRIELQNDSISSNLVPRKIIVLGWHEAGKFFLHEIGSQIHPASSVQIFFNEEFTEEKASDISSTTFPAKLEVNVADTSSFEFLSNLNWENVDEVVVLGYRKNLDTQEADALTLLTLVHLRNISHQDGYRFGIASELLDPNNRDLAKTNNSEDFIASQELISRVIAQILEKPILKSVFQQLLTSEGSEIHLRKPDYFSCLSKEVKFGSIIANGLDKGELVVGVLLRNNLDTNPELKLSPLKSETFKLEENDSVVVIAEE